MDVKAKLQILADAAKYDASCSSSGAGRKAQKGGIGNAEGSGICHSYTPDGRCVSLLKILLTNSCIYDCSYCINRVSSSVKRAKFSVEEVVKLTMDFYKRNYIEGLFLSSGVFKSSDDTMEEMVEIARRLREDEKFGGYIHLKAVAGSSKDLIEKAGRYADRLSANIELPTQKDLDHLAPAKTHVETEKSMSDIQSKIVEAKAEKRANDKVRFLQGSLPAPARATASSGMQRSGIRRPPIGDPARFAPGGQSTQMIVGATPSSDRLILATSNHLYKNYGLKRVYYSAFSPIPDSDPNLPLKSPPLIREHRLYQADWLLRFYGFKVGELTTDADPNLALEHDPKTAWAIRNRAFFPVDVNVADRENLLRVPGFGVRTVEKILEMRLFRKLRLEDLGKMHVPMNRAKYFVTAAGDNHALRKLDGSRLELFVQSREPEQLQLFELATTARTGEI